MLITFRSVLVSLLRNGGLLVWAVGLPLVLSVMFIFMFDSLEQNDALGTLPVVVVQESVEGDAGFDGSELDELRNLDLGSLDASALAGLVDPEAFERTAFYRFVRALSSEGDEEGAAGAGESNQGLLAVTYVPTEEEARGLVEQSQGADDAFVGYLLFEGGEPHACLYPTGSTMAEEAKQSIVVLLMDQYASRSALVRSLAELDPMALLDAQVVQRLFEPIQATERVSVTENPLSEKARYYFALLGFAALSCANFGMVAVGGLRASSGPLGARRAVGGISHGRALAGTLLAAWAASFICLLVVFLFMRLTVDFGNRDVGCLAVLAVSSLAAVSLGCLVAVIPRIPEGARSGIITIVTCFSALFTGLYGEPTMKLADAVAQACPASALVNPAAQITEALYGLMYYDSFTPAASHLGILLAMTAIMFALSVRALGRQRYASL